MRYKLLIVLLVVTSSLSAQTVDSVKYWHHRYDTCAYKVIAAREALWHIQDYINLCKKNPKLNKYDVGWTQRILRDYYTKSGWIPKGRHKVIKHK